MSSKTSRTPHPVHLVHRIGAGVLGAGLWVFAALGFANGLPMFSTSGEYVLGLSSNGALSTISVVAGALLLSAAAWTGPAASTITAVLGGLFVLSGLAHLAILHTPVNLLAFRLPNVFFSLVAGLILLVLGLYGRATGNLPADNPYRRARHERRAHSAELDTVAPPTQTPNKPSSTLSSPWATATPLPLNNPWSWQSDTVSVNANAREFSDAWTRLNNGPRPGVSIRPRAQQNTTSPTPPSSHPETSRPSATDQPSNSFRLGRAPSTRDQKSA